MCSWRLGLTVWNRDIWVNTCLINSSLLVAMNFEHGGKSTGFELEIICIPLYI